MMSQRSSRPWTVSEGFSLPMPTAPTARSACSRDTLVTGYRLRSTAPRLAWSSRFGAVTRRSSSSRASGCRPRSYASDVRLLMVGFMRELRDLGGSLDAEGRGRRLV